MCHAQKYSKSFLRLAGSPPIFYCYLVLLFLFLFLHLLGFDFTPSSFPHIGTHLEGNCRGSISRVHRSGLYQSLLPQVHSPSLTSAGKSLLVLVAGLGLTHHTFQWRPVGSFGFHLVYPPPHCLCCLPHRWWYYTRSVVVGDSLHPAVFGFPSANLSLNLVFMLLRVLWVPGSVVWYLSWIWGNSQSLLLQIFLRPPTPFSFWYYHYMYVTHFVPVPENGISVSFSFFFSLCTSEVSSDISSKKSCLLSFVLVVALGAATCNPLPCWNRDWSLLNFVADAVDGFLVLPHSLCVGTWENLKTKQPLLYLLKIRNNV